MTEPYLYAITALLPLTASILIFQTNPYNALILRGILGALAALIYAILGAADVALTEALMGTLLAITLYAVAVRSSMVMRLGLLKDGAVDTKSDPNFDSLVSELRTILGKQYLRLELVFYQDLQSLQQALSDREVHTMITVDETMKSSSQNSQPKRH
jgi:putative multicomponent Na+:H+ antiporter subunit B